MTNTSTTLKGVSLVLAQQNGPEQPQRRAVAVAVT